MACTRLVGVLLITFTFCVSGCLGGFSPRPIRHYVNGRQGWVPHPFQDYNQWAGNNRFLAHDTLYFRYNKEQDSVLEVSKEDYDSCNTDHPIEKKQDGNSEFELKQPGPYYFISGNKTNCQQGQKLIVQVLHYPSSLPSPPSGVPTSPGPTLSPPGVHPHPLPPPAARSPSSGTTPGASGPATSPSSGTTPGASGPATSPSSGTPGASGPSTSPSSGTTPGASGPATSPSSSTTPGASGPATSPSSGSPVISGPGLSPAGAASPPSPVAPGPGAAAGGPGSSAAGGPGSSAAGGPGSSAASGPGSSAAGGPGSSAAGGPGSSAAGGPGPSAAGGPGSAETPSDQPSSDITSPSGSKNSAVKGKGFSMSVGVFSVLVSLIMWLN